MKLATFQVDGDTRVGVVDGDRIADLSVLAPELPTDLVQLLAQGPSGLSAARRAIESSTQRIPLTEVTLLSPIPRPGKVLAIGLNYEDHIAETGKARPEYPTVFNKQTTCITSHRSPIHLPRVSSALDYEGELAFVIGRRCRHVPKERAREVIAGYCIMNDVTVRDIQLRTPTWTMGKSFDTHGPLGPWLTTADEVPDPHTLSLRTWVNGELRQNSNTSNLVFNCDFLVEYLTQAFTLEPGDVISTGTPSGVGGAMNPPKFLRAGDVVRIEIEGLGSLQNHVIDEPADTTRI